MPVYEGYRWGSGGYGDLGKPAAITWCFADAALLSYRDTIVQGFTAWEAVCGIDFVEVNSGGSLEVTVGELDNYWGWAEWWAASGTQISEGTITFDPVILTNSSRLYWTAVHEAGHILGFGHMTDPSSMMDPDFTASNRSGQLTADDIAGAQYLYGMPGIPVTPQATAQSVAFIETTMKGVLREDPSDALANSEGLRLDAGLSQAAYLTELMARAEDSTVPALIVADFITGKTPTSTKLDSLADFAEVQHAHYTAMGVMNPDLGPYEALGMGFSETAEFRAKFGGSTESLFITSTYKEAFGRDATGAQTSHFQAQLDYFESLYLSAGVASDAAAIRAKGAVVGQMLGYAAVESGNRFGSAADAFLSDAADGAATYSVSLIGTYGTAEALVMG